MMRWAAAMGVTVAVGLLACASAPSPAEKGRAIQGAFAANRAACLILLTDPTIPRDSSAERYCALVLRGEFSAP